LFEYVKTQNQSKLLEILSLAFDTMDTNQRHEVFGKTAKDVPPSSLDGKKILTTIEQFYEKSMDGYYYAPFDINSKSQDEVKIGFSGLRKLKWWGPDHRGGERQNYHDRKGHATLRRG
jgi:hypothetical protein